MLGIHECIDAREGGLPSTLWAGPEHIGRAVREGRYPVQGTAGRRHSIALKLGFGEDEFTPWQLGAVM